MTELCENAGLPKPVFSFQNSDFWVEFRKDIYHIEYLQLLGLNNRQLDALLFYKTKGEIVSSDYQKRFDIAERTARYDLTELVEKDLLIKQGDKKATKYVFR